MVRAWNICEKVAKGYISLHRVREQPNSCQSQKIALSLNEIGDL
jgi:hypothetical protein